MKHRNAFVVVTISEAKKFKKIRVTYAQHVRKLWNVTSNIRYR